MTRILGPTGSGRRRRSAAIGAVFCSIALLGLVVVPAQAVLDRDLFELDKNAQDDVTTFRDPGPPAVVTGPLGTLRSNIDAVQTSFEVCQASSTNPPDGTTILVDAEQMTVGTITNVAGGGCSGAFKRSYSNVSRGADITPPLDGTTAAAHSGGENVTRITVAPVDGDDWDQVYANIVANPASACDTTGGGETDLGAVACTFVHDGRQESIFTSSKDYDEIVDWQWRDQSVPDADELDDGFAVKYTDDDQNVFFGADRAATNGSKDAGFWFFHDAVATIDGVPPADGTFDGEHTAPDPGPDGVFCGIAGQTTPNCSPYDDDDTGGDVLILTTFSNGGATVTVRVFEWFGPGGSSAALFQRATQGDCVPGTGTQSLCATVNDTTIESPWPYDGKGEPVDNEMNAGAFLEGGINLSDLGLEGCFSSFMATTRSAPSVTADPKDFILGEFEACASDLTTTPADSGGTPLTDTDDPPNGLPDIPIGTGAAGVDVTDSANLTVSGTNTWSGTLDFFLCGPIADPDTCLTGGVPILPSLDVDNTDTQPFVSASANLTEVGRYCWRGVFTSDDPEVPGDTDASEGECFEVTPVTPTLTTTAVDADGNPLTGPVDFGEALYDKATLTGTAYQPGTDGPDATYQSINATMDTPANSKITFTLVGPDGATTDCTTVATGTPQTSNPEDATVSGDGDYFTTGFTPDAPGDYHWKASYTADPPNTLGTSHNDACDEAGEDVTVQQIPTEIKTKQSWFPNDTATITSSVAGDLLEAGGTVVFSLFDTATCTGDALYTETETLTGGAHSEEVGTSNTSVAVTTGYDDVADSVAGPYSWKVVYTPAAGDTAHTGIQSACDAEHFSITYTNDPGPGTDL